MNENEGPLDIIKDAINWLGNIFTRQHKEMLTILRQPTAIHHTTMLTTGPTGQIGPGVTGSIPGGMASDILYQAPLSHEAWINRMVISSPAAPVGTPITTGSVLCTGSVAGELVFFLPLSGVVAPVIITEGRLSAPHLPAGEKLYISGAGLPANTAFKFDLQVVLVSGISIDTPRDTRSIDITP